MTLYLDSSALVKRYVEEEGSELVDKAIEEASSLTTCRITFIETLRAVIDAAEGTTVRAVRRDWKSLDVINVDQGLCERAVELAVRHRLRSLDALHLAAASAIAHEALTFAVFDRRLHAAATAEGLQTLPASLP